jgi:hypothetical protein
LVLSGSNASIPTGLSADANGTRCGAWLLGGLGFAVGDCADIFTLVRSVDVATA